MTPQQKRLLRTALAIDGQLRLPMIDTTDLKLPTEAWQNCQTLLRKIQRAQRRGWLQAVGSLQSDLCLALGRLQGEVFSFDRRLEPPETRHRASLLDMISDLAALEEEFDEVECDRRQQTLSVTTEPIQLENIQLGPFEIRLDWSDLSDGHPNNYRVYAQDPNPAESNDGVTHPHVQDGVVCEGEGRQPIRKALEQGRLLDFFVIVASLLRTYNPGSPFVALSDWHGVECADCGISVSGEDRRLCDNCDANVCTECYLLCPGCDAPFCNECVTCCRGCDEVHCNGCLTTCSRCYRERCQGCLDDNHRCSNCHDQQSNQDDQQPMAGARDAGAPLQPHRLGEAAVSA